MVKLSSGHRPLGHSALLVMENVLDSDPRRPVEPVVKWRVSFTENLEARSRRLSRGWGFVSGCILGWEGPGSHLRGEMRNLFLGFDGPHWRFFWCSCCWCCWVDMPSFCAGWDERGVLAKVMWCGMSPGCCCDWPET